MWELRCDVRKNPYKSIPQAVCRGEIPVHRLLFCVL